MPATPARAYTRDDASRRDPPVNTEYLLWFGALVVVAGGALLWLAIGEVPEIPPGSEAGEPDPAAAEHDPAVDLRDPAAREPGPAAEASGPRASELAGEDGVAESA
jgi:hypothetical protein